MTSSQRRYDDDDDNDDEGVYDFKDGEEDAGDDDGVMMTSDGSDDKRWWWLMKKRLSTRTMKLEVQSGGSDRDFTFCCCESFKSFFSVRISDFMERRSVFVLSASSWANLIFFFGNK